jgi:hypothetical protein
VGKELREWEFEGGGGRSQGWQLKDVYDAIAIKGGNWDRYQRGRLQFGRILAKVQDLKVAGCVAINDDNTVVNCFSLGKFLNFCTYAIFYVNFDAICYVNFVDVRTSINRV